jgi:hypothetical protein
MFKDIVDSLTSTDSMDELGFVFLGGTCSDTNWRDTIIPRLDIEYFNPVVKNWTPEAQQTELQKRAQARYVLYMITPAMTGVYSIAEAVDDSNRSPLKTLFCFVNDDNVKGKSFTFSDPEIRSLTMVGEMIQRNGATWLKSMDEVIIFLNSKKGLSLR